MSVQARDLHAQIMDKSIRLASWASAPQTGWLLGPLMRREITAVDAPFLLRTVDRRGELTSLIGRDEREALAAHLRTALDAFERAGLAHEDRIPALIDLAAATLEAWSREIARQNYWTPEQS